jgi:hypothetical protein
MSLRPFKRGSLIGRHPRPFRSISASCAGLRPRRRAALATVSGFSSGSELGQFGRADPPRSASTSPPCPSSPPSILVKSATSGLTPEKPASGRDNSSPVHPAISQQSQVPVLPANSARLKPRRSRLYHGLYQA